MVATGLKAFKQQQEDRKNNSGSPFFKPEKGQKVRIRPLVELDEDGKNYSEDRGHAYFTTEFANPQKFWLSVVEHPDDDGNVGRDLMRKFGWYKQKDADTSKNQHSDRDKNWNPKQRFYLPVVVDRLDGSEPTVEVLQLAYGDRAPAAPLVSFYESRETITDRWWDYSRNEGDGMDTKYSFVPDDPSDFDFDKYEVPDTTKPPYTFHLPYEEQAAHLQVNLNEPAPVQASPAAAKATEDEPDW